MPPRLTHVSVYASRLLNIFNSLDIGLLKGIRRIFTELTALHLEKETNAITHQIFGQKAEVQASRYGGIKYSMQTACSGEPN